jgi:hypothetical protein
LNALSINQVPPISHNSEPIQQEPFQQEPLVLRAAQTGRGLQWLQENNPSPCSPPARSRTGIPINFQNCHAASFIAARPTAPFSSEASGLVLSCEIGVDGSSEDRHPLCSRSQRCPRCETATGVMTVSQGLHTAVKKLRGGPGAIGTAGERMIGCEKSKIL